LRGETTGYLLSTGVQELYKCIRRLADSNRAPNTRDLERRALFLELRIDGNEHILAHS